MPPAAGERESPTSGYGRSLPVRRRVAGAGLAVVGLPALTAALVPLRSTLSLPSQMLLFLLVVVGVALVGGMAPAVLAAVAAFLLLNWYFTPPFGTLSIAQHDHLLALIVFIGVAMAVSAVVEFAAASASRAASSEAEALLIARLAKEAPAEVGLTTVLRELLATFPLGRVRVEQRSGAEGWTVLAAEGQAESPESPESQERHLVVPDDPDLRLVLVGPPLFAEDARLLGRFVTAVATAVRAGRLAAQAADAERLAAAESLRTALLAAVGHDLRTPLAGIKAAVSTLRQSDIDWSPAEQAELHATIEESADQLSRLLTNLLDLSRLEAGSVRVVLESVLLDGTVAEAVRSAGNPPVVWDLPEDLPVVLADAGLLERVIANLVANAVQHGGTAPTLSARPHGSDAVLFSVVDGGPGVADEDLERIFAPFQRLDDHGRGGGLGLGLAVARGFVDAMGGAISAGHTPGGGLTVQVRLPVGAGRLS